MDETTINLIAEGTRLEGRIILERLTRVNGTLVGEVHARPGNLILSETAVVEGNIFAETLWIDGYVHGNIECSGKVTVSRTGRVQGDIRARSVELEFGAFFEGKCMMEEIREPKGIGHLAPVPE